MRFTARAKPGGVFSPLDTGLSGRTGYGTQVLRHGVTITFVLALTFRVKMKRILGRQALHSCIRDCKKYLDAEIGFMSNFTYSDDNMALSLGDVGLDDESRCRMATTLRCFIEEIKPVIDQLVVEGQAEVS